MKYAKNLRLEKTYHYGKSINVFRFIPNYSILIVRIRSAYQFSTNSAKSIISCSSSRMVRLQAVQPSKRKQIIMILELIGFAILLVWSALVLMTFMAIGDYIRNKNNKEIITKTPINSTIDELYKQKRTR